jgi:hypothetical protein
MSIAGRNWIRIGVGLALAVAGFLCLNYTKAFGVEHHFEWANAEGMPEPSHSIFVAGALLLAIGGVLLGRVRRG